MIPVRGLVLVAASWIFQGCAVGYHWYRTPGLHATGGPAKWPPCTVLVDSPRAPQLRAIAVHLLRAQHGIIDARFENESNERAVTLSFDIGPRQSSEALLFPSFVTFSLLPGYGKDEREVTVTAAAPDGARTTVSRTLRSVILSWLPLAFAAPNWMASLDSNTDDVGRARTTAEEQIVEDLLEEIAPFVAAHVVPGP